MLKLLSRTTILFFFLLSQNGWALVVHDPVNLVQNRLSALNSAKALLNQAKEIELQLNTYETALRNLKTMPKQIWQDTVQDVQRLTQIHQRGLALAQQLSQTGKPFQELLAYRPEQENYPQAYARWSKTASETIDESLKNTQAHAELLEQESQSVEQIKRLSEKSEGNLQAVQAANMLAASQIDQLQKLRQLILSEMQAQNTYYSFQLTKEQESQQLAQSVLEPLNQPVPVYGRGIGFGETSFPV